MTLPHFYGFRTQRQVYGFTFLVASLLLGSHTVVFAQDSNSNGSSTSIPTNISELKGENLINDAFKQHLTTGRPTDDDDNIFFLYNVGAGKFLNIGSYWGTHADLSTVPRRFWFQNRNEELVAKQWATIRFPISYSQGTFNYDIFHISPMQIGSTQGDTRSTATYHYVRVMNNDGNTTAETLWENYSPNKDKFSKDITIDFDNQYIEAEIDVSNVTGSSPQNILSMGEDISKWANYVTDFHIYGYESSGHKLLRSQCLYSGYADATHKTTIDITALSPDNIAKVIIRQGSITINGVECLVGNKTNTYTNPIKSFYTDFTNFQVGSAYGDIRTHAIYNSVKLTRHKESEGTIDDNAVEPGYASEGKSFMKEYKGNLNTLSFKAEIDLTNCSNDKENIISIGNQIKDWGNVSKGIADIHFYWRTGNKIEIDPVSKGDGKKYQKTIDLGDNKTLKVELNSKGLYVNDNLIYDATSTTDDANSAKEVLDYLLSDKTTIMQVGSTEGDTRSNATYNSIVVTLPNSSTQTSELYTNHDCNGEVTTQNIGSFTFEGTEKLEADIDLSQCTTSGENVISIGSNIIKWGHSSESANKGDNIHIFYLGTEGDNYKLYAAIVNDSHDNDAKRIFYVPKSGTMKLLLNESGLTVNDNLVFTDNDPVPSVPYIADHEGEIVKFKCGDTTNKILETDEYGKYIIVYPDQEGYADGMTLKNTIDGYLYTAEDETRDDGSVPFFLSSRFTKETTSSKKNEGQFLGWAPPLNGDKWGNVGVYADRNLPQTELGSTTQSLNAEQWFFQPVEGKENTYRIYLDMDNEELQVRGEKGSYGYVTKSGRFYLQATADNVLGNGLEYYGGDYDANPITSTHDGVDAILGLPEDDKYAEWKVFNINDYYKLFQAANSEMSNMLDLTFLLTDPNFTRENAELKEKWQMDNTLAGKIRIGIDHFSKKALDDTDYSKDNYDGKLSTDDTGKFNSIKQRINNHGRYMGVDINGIDKTQESPSGKFYQTVTLTNAGWYAIRCGGITTVGSELYAQFHSEVVQQPLHQLTKGEYKLLRRNGSNVKWPFDHIDGEMPMYNAIVAMNDENAASDSYNQDYRGLYEKFNNQIVFFIDPDILTQNGGSMDVTFGINVAPNSSGVDLLSDDGDEDTTVKSNDDDEPETSIQWTVFDNFQLLFGGNDGEPFLILDEDDTDLHHIDETIHKYRSGTSSDGKVIDKQLLLHRTFSAGNWNSFMLPVGLTKAQYDETFKVVNADGTTTPGSEAAPLAELTELTKRSIVFVTVQDSSQYTGAKKEDGSLYDETKYWMKPMTPYIIKTSKAHGDDTETYTAHLYEWKSNGKTYLEKSIGGANKPYFRIHNINMVEGVVKNAASTEESTFGSKWDFAHMTTTINGIEYPYIMKGQVAKYNADADDKNDDKEVDVNGKMTAYGHLVRNFTIDESGTFQLINTETDKRAPMSDSYVLSNNKLIYLDAGAASRGFRCWFQYESGNTTSAKPMLILDGIDMTTDIGDIYANDNGISPIDRFKEGIFTLSGQLISKDTSLFQNLSKGIYIVNGKKIVKE